jgi:putative peptidoglycan lipid II flippase
VTKGSTEDVTTQVRWVSLCTILSRILGLVRDAAMAARFGNGPWLDAFTVAFRIPNLARALLGEGALTTAFLPAYLAVREEAGRDAARRLATAVAIAVIWTTLGIVLLAEGLLLLAGWFTATSPGAELLRRLLMGLTPYLALICVAAQCSAVLNAERRFLVPALVPTALNLVWLTGLAVAGLWTDPAEQLAVMTAAVVLGGVAQVALPGWSLHRQGLTYDPAWREAWSSVRRIFRQMLPVVGGLLITQINVFIDGMIAWGFTAPPGTTDPWRPLDSGTASALYFGQRLYQFPLGVFGVALGTVLFPLLTEHAQAHDYVRLREDFTLGLRYVVAIGCPASAGLMLLAGPLASLCFEYGAFDADDARHTGHMIAAYGSGVWAYCGLLIISRGFYALGDRLTPLRVGLWAVVGNVLLSLGLIWPLGGPGLAWSTAVISMLQCLVAGWLYRSKIGGFAGGSLRVAVFRAVVATIAMSLVGLTALWQLATIDGWPGRALRVVAPLAAALAVYFLTARLIGFHEPFEILLTRRRGPVSSRNTPPT